MKLSRISAGAVACLTTVLLVAGCAPAGTPSTADGELGTVCFIPKFVGHPAFALADDGAQEAGKELGVTVNYVGSTKIDPAEQIKTIDNCIQQGVGAIIIGALDPNALVPSLQRAQDAGIVVVAWDADVAIDSRSLYISPADVPALGEALAEAIVESSGGDGEWAVLSSGPDVANNNEWIEASTSVMAGDSAKFGGLTLVDTVYGESDDQKSYLAAQGLIDKYPNLKVIMSPDAAGLPATARAIQDAGLCGQVKATGVALPSAMGTYLDAGCVDSFTIWNFRDLGYLAVYAAQAVAQGDKIVEGGTVDAGTLGARTIGTDGTVPLGDPLVITQDNIAQFQF